LRPKKTTKTKKKFKVPISIFCQNWLQFQEQQLLEKNAFCGFEMKSLAENSRIKIMGILITGGRTDAYCNFENANFPTLTNDSR
jgi:hypothetical protein